MMSTIGFAASPGTDVEPIADDADRRRAIRAARDRDELAVDPAGEHHVLARDHLAHLEERPLERLLGLPGIRGLIDGFSRTHGFLPLG